MSQGELHAMALSLFLPRATLPESPFRFVVIDDPVQSMDPARVDGLARVLDKVARDRQVIVFTHDDRLPESVRRLGIDARVIAVTRHEDSVVDLTTVIDPTERNLDDAEAVADAKDVPDDVRGQVVPGFCRAAIEATCIEIVRRRRIGRGEAHVDVEHVLEENGQLRSLLSLALFDTAAKGRRGRGQGQGVGPVGACGRRDREPGIARRRARRAAARPRQGDAPLLRSGSGRSPHEPRADDARRSCSGGPTIC